MKTNYFLFAPLLGCFFLGACASSTGVVSMGGGRYFVAKQQATGFPGLGNLKAEIMSEAASYCSNKGLEIQLIREKETQPPYLLGNYPRAEIEFKCVAVEK